MRFELFTRESKWSSYDGTEVPIKDLEDTHILNLIEFTYNNIIKAQESVANYVCDGSDYSASKLELRVERLEFKKQVHEVINAEVELRGLDLSRVSDGKRLPFLKNGEWMVWKKGERSPTAIPKSIDFIKPVKDW